LREFWSEYRGVRDWLDGQENIYQNGGKIQSLNGRIRDEILPGNEIINTPGQGSASEIVLEAQNALYLRAITEDMNFLPRFNIHDDLGFILPIENEDILESYIRDIALEIVKVRFPFITVPLTTECRIGTDWASLEAITTFTGNYYDKIGGNLIIGN